MGEMMREMMREMMGVRAPKELYPSLMDMPAISAERRQAMEAEARVRLGAGLEELSEAEEALRHALAARDGNNADQAARRLREALNRVNSDTTLLKSLGEGRQPQQIALDWFKSQLSLPVSAPSKTDPYGLSWFHLITMSLVSVFAFSLLVIQILRIRRANALAIKLTSASSAAATTKTGIEVSARSATADTSPASPAPASAAVSAAPTNPPDSSASVARVSEPGKPWKGRLQVAAIFRETPSVKTFRLKDPQGGPIPFRFTPGQFLTYSAEISGQLVRRSYTMASSASQTAYVETTIKREDSGVFSEYMHDTVSVGDMLDVTAPSGTFTFRGVEADSVVLIGGGVGITPLMAAIRYLTDIAWPGEIFLVYGARTSADFIFHDELEYLQRHHTNLHVAATMARAAGTSWFGPEGPITKEFLAQVVPEIARRRVHLCGPPGMMEAIKKCLAELGVPSGQIKTEAFGPARGAVPPPGVTLIAPILSDRSSPTPNGTGAIAGPATATVRFSRSDKTAALPPDKTVLEVAESIGVPIDYACRSGICGTCKVRLLEGKVTMDVQDALTPEDKTNNIILACQAKSVGDLVVEA